MKEIVVVTRKFIDILDEFEKVLRESKTEDTVNKNYRQVRVWNRIECVWLHHITPDERRELNKAFDAMRRERLEEIHNGR